MNKPAAQRLSSRPRGDPHGGPHGGWPRGEWLKRLALVIGATIAGLIALEIGLRAITGTYLFTWPNFVLEARTVQTTRDGNRYVHDDRLGYIPRPGYAGPDYTGPGNIGAATTIEVDGLRSTGGAGSGPPILAVGDSFVFGDEVADSQTWPAQLQLLTGRRVLNGGVSGYGFDQIVLRAEHLAAKYRPFAIVVGFIADDIRRTEMRRLWSADKPYFDLVGDRLELHGVPVPPRAEPRMTLTFWQRTLGYSYLFDFILRRLDLLHDWFGDHVRVHPAGTGERIACRLTDRLAALQRDDGAKVGAKVIVVAQYDPVVWDDPAFAAEQRRLTSGLLDCAQRNGLATIDTFPALADAANPRSLYILWHMSEAGNRLIAKLAAEKL